MGVKGDYDMFWKTSVVIMGMFLTTVVTKLLMSSSSKKKKKKSVRVPPVVQASPPLIGTLFRFIKGPMSMLREEYSKLGSVFTAKLLHKNLTFFIGPEVSEHFFNAYESDLS